MISNQMNLRLRHNRVSGVSTDDGETLLCSIWGGGGPEKFHKKEKLHSQLHQEAAQQTDPGIE